MSDRPISPQFVKGLRANIAYWQEKTNSISDTDDSSIRADFLNLVRAVQLGTVHPATRLETAELMCQIFFWVEQTGQWDIWLPLMKRLIPKIEDKTMCCRLYRQQGQLYRSRQMTDEAIDALHSSAKYAEQIPNELMLAEAHLHLSATYLQKRDSSTAERYAQSALQRLSTMTGVEKQVSAIYFTLGRATLMKGDFAQSESHLITAVDIGREVQSPTQFARILAALAISLHSQNKYEASERAYLEAIHMIDGTVSILDKIRLQLSLGSLYVDMNQLSSAEALFMEAAHTLQSVPGQFHLIAVAANNLGNVLLEKGELMAAEHQLRRSVELRRTLNIQLPLANSCKSWGKALNRLARYQEAIGVIDEALSILANFEDDIWAQEIIQECVILRTMSESAMLNQTI